MYTGIIHSYTKTDIVKVVLEKYIVRSCVHTKYEDAVDLEMENYTNICKWKDETRIC